MKNIHLISTDKPSKLFAILEFNYIFDKNNNYTEVYKKWKGYKNKHVFITSDEEIKEGNWCLSKLNEIILFGKNYTEQLYKKIILTTDQDLINDDVQDIDDDFLQWFVKNSSCEKVEVKKWSSLAECGYSYHIVIPKEEQKQHLIDIMKGDEELGLYELGHEVGVQVERSKQETIKEDLMEFAKRESNNDNKHSDIKLGYQDGIFYGILEGSKWMQKQMYSEEDMKLAFETGRNFQLTGENNFVELIEQFKNK